MRERFEIPMPMWRALYHVAGGHGRVLGVPAVLAGVMILGAVLLHQLLDARQYTRAVSAISNIILAVECSVLILGGSNSIYRAMLRDYETHMIDSHRLTPMSNIGVTLGYLIGPTFQMLLMFLVMGGVGAAVISLAGTPIAGWAIGHLFLLNGALSFWAFSVFIGMRNGKPVSPAPIAIALAMFSFAMMLVPGFGLITGVYAMVFGFMYTSGVQRIPLDAMYALAAVSLVLTAFWVSTSAAKYRRPDLPALNPARGMVLFALWLLLASAGIVIADHFTRTSMTAFDEGPTIRIQWTVTMIASLVFAAVPISGAVECARLAGIGHALRGATDRWSSLWVSVAAGALICGVMALAGWNVQPIAAPVGERLATQGSAWGWSLGACLSGCLTLRAVLILTANWSRGRWFVAGFLIIMLWSLPPILDGVRADLLRIGERPTALSALVGFSPAGTLAAVWLQLPIALWPGMIGQVLITAGLTAWASVATGRTGRGESELVVS